MINADAVRQILDRQAQMFASDMGHYEDYIRGAISSSRILVVGGAGSIGGAVVREIFARNPRVLHVIDASENCLAELVRDLRSSVGYIAGDFHAFCFDALGPEFEALTRSSIYQGYDYVLNFSALKHVRSEKDPFTLMRLVDVNISLARKLHQFVEASRAKKFFCVSTDKASNPVNMMGASKRIMEMFLVLEQSVSTVSTARFANVAFSNGSLPDSWCHRFEKNQPIVAPVDINRYFVTAEESAVLCLLGAILGNNHEIFFPKFSASTDLLTFRELAIRFLHFHGFEPYECASEDEARNRLHELKPLRKWPCYFFNTDTSGEKVVEEFFCENEEPDLNRFADIGVVWNTAKVANLSLDDFSSTIARMRRRGYWETAEFLHVFDELLPNFNHLDRGRSLDEKM